MPGIMDIEFFLNIARKRDLFKHSGHVGKRAEPASRFDWQLPRAAATLGAGPGVALATIILPLILPSIAGAFIFSFFVGFDDVNVALFLANPYDRPLPIVMLDDIRDTLNPRTASVAVIFFLAAVLLCLLQAVVQRIHSYVALHRFEPAKRAPAASGIEVEA